MRIVLLMSFLCTSLLSVGQRIRLKEQGGQLYFYRGDQPMIGYQFTMAYPPQGVDTFYRRSGFIHPVYAPDGQVLTRIQPPDHYHHYGIWNPWTHTVFRGDTIDFWNLNKRQGTVRFASFIEKINKRRYAAFTALHEHVVLLNKGRESVALNERLEVKVHRTQKNPRIYVTDITSRLECATDDPFEIVAYRYGGLGWRATSYWDKMNSEMLTSEGKDRDHADNTRARWIIVSGRLPELDEGGIVMMSHPANYNHPEPLRIWDKTQNEGRGDVFANFAPTKDKNWLLLPGQTYTLRYRLLIFNGRMDKDTVEKAWIAFSNTQTPTQ